MKKCIVSLIEKPMVQVAGWPDKWPVVIPDGCLGICYAFESKKAAYKWYGKKVRLIEVETIKEERKTNVTSS